MEVQMIKGFQCNTCGQIYEEEDEAEDCCPNDVNKIDGWKCGECDEIYEDKEEAKECCK